MAWVSRSVLNAYDNNWYSYWNETEALVNGFAFARWQADSGLDAASGWGPIPGVTTPLDSSDPRLWDADYMQRFAPSADFAACAGPDTPGASIASASTRSSCPAAPRTRSVVALSSAREMSVSLPAMVATWS